jgi:nucleoside-diphosphate-sugar epimerase
MKIFITGGTGYIGSRLVKKLAARGDEVVIFARDPLKAGDITGSGITCVAGDILDYPSVLHGMKGCDLVFHLCGYARPWSKDRDLPYRINVTGSENVFRSAVENQIPKVVFTSTAGTMGSSADGNPVNETTRPHPVFFNDYEKTKAQAEEKAMEYAGRGLPVMIVNPSRVYGPGKLVVSNSVTRIIRLYALGRWRIIPGDGSGVGNYVFIDDVLDGHLMAAEKGRPGQRYILGGENIPFDEFFRILGTLIGKKKRMIHLPAGIMTGIASLMGFISGITGIPPMITREWVKKYLRNSSLSCGKAAEELGYSFTPFREGARKTLHWLGLL